MKSNRLLIATLATVALSLGACSDSIETPVESGDGFVTFTAQLPEGVNSRAYSEGELAQTLKYAVYESGTTTIIYSSDDTNAPVAQYGNKNFTLSLPLVKGQTYDLIFWAEAAPAEGAASPYTFDPANQTISIDYKDIKCNEEARDAFFSAEKGLLVTGAMQKNIELYRPFAQLNIGTNDIEAAKKAKIELGTTSVSVNGVYSKLNLFTGVASETADVEFGHAERPTGESFPVTGYDYLSMNYILTGDQIIGEDVNQAQKETKDITIAIKDKDGKDVNSFNLSAVPFQRNYRTNIYGALLTSTVDYTIEIVPDYNTPDNNIIVESEEALAEAVKNGGNITLVKDIDITNDLGLTDKPVIIDLNGHDLDIQKAQAIGDGNKLTIKGSGEEELAISDLHGFDVNSGELEIDGVKLVDNFDRTVAGNENKTAAMVFIQDPNSTTTIKNTTIVPNNIFTYAITTNASNSDQNIKINLDKVKVLPSVIISCPVLFNLPMTVNATDCEFEGCNQAIILRGGTYTFENCTFTQTLAFDENGTCTTTPDEIKNTFRNQDRENWGQGTRVPLAAITMGNKGTSAYQYPTSVTLKGCTVNIPEVAKVGYNGNNDVDSSLPAIYISANAGEGLGVTFTYDDDTKINGAIEYEPTNISNITVNGKTAE